MRTLIINIKELLQVREIEVDKVSGHAMKDLPTIKNAFVAINNDRISNFGWNLNAFT